MLLLLSAGVGDGVLVLAGEGLAEAVDGELGFALGFDFTVVA